MSDDKDMSMTDEQWQKVIAPVDQHYKDHHKELKADKVNGEDWGESLTIIRSQIKRGNRNAANRVKYYTLIKDEGRDLPHWPIKKGQQSKLPQALQDSLNTMGDELASAYEAFWEANPIVQATSIISDRNKELGGSQYNDGAAFAASRVLAMRQRFIKHFTSGRWDGEYSADGMTITPPPQDNDAGDDSSDES